jgi:hypothetical protein
VLPAEPETDTVPDGVCDANAVVKLTEPPVDAVPLTTLSAALSWSVNFVNPVGAAVCPKIITVPEGIVVPPAAQVWSPRKNVVLLAVPEAKRAVATVPLEMFEAFKLVTFEPVPLNAMFMLH